MTSYSFNALRGKKTLITGDVGSGKTMLTRKLLDEAIEQNEDTTVIDFAPVAKIVKGIKVGGHLVREDEKIRVLKSDDIATPRLSAANADDLLRLTEINREITKQLLTSYIKDPTPVLFINDVSIHLQSGELEPILEAARKAETVIINGYMGEALKDDLGSGVSHREHTLMNKLRQAVDQEIRLGE
ncbi:hypothetical protein GF326_12065 [Candidatus Bathyarchaeota archaeon]|nr:hypothetical protein [Candidatus Bathyarchaeota archaeon]